MSVLLKRHFYVFLAVTILLCGITAIAFVQFWTPTLYGADGYLHIRMAEFIRDHGLRYDFHWAKYSVFAKNFADKDLLYHILLIPFASLFPNMFLGAKISAIFFSAVFLFVFFRMLRIYSIKPLIPLFLLLVLLSDRFFYLFCWPRQMILVIALTIMGIHFLINERLLRVFIVTFVYCLGHVSGPYMIAYALLVETARFFNGGRFNIKILAGTGLAIVAAYLIHPNFPNNILVFYLNSIMVPLYSVKWGLELGAEFFPISSRDYLLSYPFMVLSVISIFFVAVCLRPKAALRTQVFLLISSVYFVFSFLSQRYIAQGYPLMLLTTASCVKDYFESETGRQTSARLRFLFRSAITLTCVLAVCYGIFMYKNLRDFAFTSNIFDSHYEKVGNFLKEKAPEGEIIFHANWSDSQYFIGVNPDNDYFVTFDPIYMACYDRRLYDLYRDVSFGRTKDPYDILKNVFKVNYGYVGKNYFSGLIEQIRKDPRFKILGEDGLGVVFKLNY